MSNNILNKIYKLFSTREYDAFNNKGKLFFKLKLKTIFILNKNLIIVCIGTPRISGDSAGPMIGSKLISRNYKVPVFGTIKNPIHANNLDEELSKIKTKYPNHKILAIDACATYNFECLNKITLENGPIRPGKGVDRKLQTVGDYNIKIINVLLDDYNTSFDCVNMVDDRIVKKLVDSVIEIM